MFRRHVVLAQLMGFQHAVFQRLFRPGTQFDPGAGRLFHFRIVQCGNLIFQFFRHRFIAHPHGNSFGDRGVRLQKRQQQMLCPHIGLLQVSGNTLRQQQNLLRLLGKASEYRHGKFLSVFTFRAGLDGTQHRIEQAAHIPLHQVCVHPAEAVGTQVADRRFLPCHH